MKLKNKIYSKSDQTYKMEYIWSIVLYKKKWINKFSQKKNEHCFYVMEKLNIRKYVWRKTHVTIKTTSQNLTGGNKTAYHIKLLGVSTLSYAS